MYYDQLFLYRKFIFTSRQGELTKFYNGTAVKITGFGPKGAEYRNITARFFEKGHNKVGSIDTVDKIYKFKFMFKA